ncbi:DUF2975 domain-containing protein [Arthrobacter crusticola]|uniref:DUF2975 domain-containing protein n=1 Tax=Arthrobacter crusticola TaxID=2547960 RepID=A0A4R5TSH3_9MICC|nr:DUF2975 domain-containing protein [Arthrobacter crusticola]TDK23924.1 DUF2975 domain-containing protein [Arthrobacter crusticola]
MHTSTQYPSALTVVVARTALGLLFGAVVAGQIFSVIKSQSLAAAYPEFSQLQAPLVAAALAFGICVEAVLAAAAVLTGYTRDHRIFGPSALKLVGFMAGALAVATAILVVTLFMIPGPPALGFSILGGVVLGTALTVVLRVLRSRLRNVGCTPVQLGHAV